MKPNNNNIESISAIKFAENLKIKRLENNLSVSKLAKELDISQGYLSNIENLKKIPTLYIIDKVAEYFKIEVYELFM